MIDTPHELVDLVERARNADAVAIDTEFVWERTYYPNLGLVQVGLGNDDVHLIDATAVDLAPLGALLRDESVVKILHDAIQDLTILRRATGSDPRNIFDTRLAAGFVGLGATISLQALLSALVNVSLPKGATRSDWLQRPLTDEQLSYAADDVRYMPAAYRELLRRLDQRGRTDWAMEEMAHLDDPTIYTEDDPRERFQNVRGSKRNFGSRDYAVLREVTAWREGMARRQNRPRGHIIDDSVLLEIAQRKPISSDDLKRIRSLSGRDADRYGGDIVESVQRALELPRSDWPDAPERRQEDSTLVPRLDLTQAFIRGRSEREGVDPGLVASRADVERLVSEMPPDPDIHPILRGWRREFIGGQVEELLSGRAAVALDERGLPRFISL